ncbi:MAG: HAMP domain-containing protein, partial [Gammaproteobacteria bacterium]
FFKVTTDLSVAHDAFLRVQRRLLSRLELLGESHRFRTSLEVRNRRALADQLAAYRAANGLSYLWLTDLNGRRLDAESEQLSPPTSLRIAAAQGKARAGVEIFDQRALRVLSPELAQRVRLPLLPTPRARPSRRTEEDRGMMIRVLYPLHDSEGGVVALLDAGVLLNGNFAFVDGIRDLVYGKGSLLDGSIGTVTVFLDDVRISTNVPLRAGERALGTRVSDEVRTRVLDEGQNWIDRAFVVNDWYISAYEPIVDTAGRRVGMLYAGYLEAPYRQVLLTALGVLALLFIGLMLLAGYIAVWGARSIFRPVEAMSAVIDATRRGEQQRIGHIESHDELGRLACEFDQLLDQLEAQRRRIEQNASELEQKVEERTAELRRSNEELRQMVRVLRETRRQLVETEKLAALGELTAGVAHEINNPTAVILGLIDGVMEELGETAEPVREDLELTIAQVYRIRDIVDRLLQYARPGDFAGYLEELDVNRVVEQALRLIEHMRKQYEFSVQLRLEATLLVEINEQELQQVLVNLLVNAIHALPPGGGRIEIVTRDRDTQGVIIELHDNGHGMTAEQVERIFNPFYTSKPQGEGTGLGLSITYSLVRRYGGFITVDTAPGEGACFTVYLRCKPEYHADEETLMEQLAGAVGGSSQLPALASPARNSRA